MTATKVTKIEWPFGAANARLFCPFCGKKAWPQVSRPRPCAHLRFVYSTTAGAFEWLAKDLRAKREELEASPPVGNRIGAKLARTLGLENRSQAVAFEVTTGGLACGPVWFTSCVLFDLRAKAK